MSRSLTAVHPAVLDRLRLDVPTLRPMYQLSGAHDPPHSTSPSAGRTGGPINAADWHILIVDDEPDIRASLRGLLEYEGYTVGEAVDGIGGLALIRASARPLIVLLDYKMPRMNGGEMLQAVMADPRLAGRHAFIFVTANLPAFSPELLQVLATTTIPVIQKPYLLSDLLTEIERAIARLRASPDAPAP